MIILKLNSHIGLLLYKIIVSNITEQFLYTNITYKNNIVYISVLYYKWLFIYCNALLLDSINVNFFNIWQ